MAAPNSFRHLYPLDLPVEEKIRTIAQEIYGADGVDFSVPALKRLADIEKNGWSGLPVCMAKTQYSFTDDASRLGRAQGLHHPRPRPHPEDRRGLHRGPDRRRDDHARPARRPGRDAHGRGRRRQPGRPLLTRRSLTPDAPHFGFPATLSHLRWVSANRSLTSGAALGRQRRRPGPTRPTALQRNEDHQGAQHHETADECHGEGSVGKQLRNGTSRHRHGKDEGHGNADVAANHVPRGAMSAGCCGPRNGRSRAGPA